MLKLILNYLLRCAIFVLILTGCSGGGGGGGGGGDALTVKLDCDSEDIDYRGDVTLTWSASKAESCSASGSWEGEKNTSGSETITELIADSTFTLTCTDSSGGTSIAVVNITVGPNHPGTATLRWTPPTTNTDETPLTDLAGYKIYFGTAPGDYSDIITVEDNTIDSYVVDNLSVATWYFSVSAFDTSGNESEQSNEDSKVISAQ